MYSSGLSPEALFAIRLPNFNAPKAQPWIVSLQTAKDSMKPPVIRGKEMEPSRRNRQEDLWDDTGTEDLIRDKGYNVPSL